MVNNDINKAISDLKKGKFVLIYDDEEREGETDIVKASEFVKPDSVKTMRKDGGGLIFIMTSYQIANKLQLPFLSNMFEDINDKYPVLKELAADDIPYDNRSSFSLYINHRKTFTGITDNDRSLTMKEFAELAKKTKKIKKEKALEEFGKKFRTPGHVPICISSKDLLNERKGHTELVVSLLKIAGLTPVGSGCEMMGGNGKALSQKEAKRYAEKNNITFVKGRQIIEAWEEWVKK